jgi:rhamnosyltransferase
MVKVLGVVTSFYPNIEELERNINSYLPWIEHLIIWENTLKEDSRINQLTAKLQTSKAEVRTTGQNEFHASPFNQCIRWAEGNGYTHMLTMDQDSFFTGEDFAKLIEFVENNKDNNIAVFTAAKNIDKKLNGDIVEVENAATSGTIYSIDVFRKVGFFREDFLIYMVDIEFGIRVCENGFKIACLPEIVLNHNAGYAKKSKMGLLIDYYSAQSTYYIIRNTLLTWKLYPNKFPLRERINFFRYKIIYRTIKIVFEPDKIQKLKAIYTGLYHGLIGKAGRYNIY